MTATATVDLRQIPLTLLKPTEFNPRRIRPDDPKLAELAASITSLQGAGHLVDRTLQGVVQPPN